VYNYVSYTYSTAEELKEESYWGKVAVYGGGGYVQLLPTSDDKLQKLLTKLQADEWIDAGTRAVFIDFTAYNANDNLFAVVRCASYTSHWFRLRFRRLGYRHNFVQFVIDIMTLVDTKVDFHRKLYIEDVSLLSSIQLAAQLSVILCMLFGTVGCAINQSINQSVFISGLGIDIDIISVHYSVTDAYLNNG